MSEGGTIPHTRPNPRVFPSRLRRSLSFPLVPRGVLTAWRFTMFYSRCLAGLVLVSVVLVIKLMQKSMI